MTAWYLYDDLTFNGDDDLQWGGEGNPVRIITEQAADPGVYSAVHFVYDLGQRVWLMYGETWEEDGADEGDCPDNYEIVWAREFRYDGGRARYLNRELDPQELQDNGILAALEDGEETWTVYDGDEAYADYTVEEDTPDSTVTDLRSYEPGVALKDPIDESSGIEYYHTDHLGTTRTMTDDAGDCPTCGTANAPVYTAFGERIDAGGHHRYGYIGAYGYQAHDFPNGSPIQFLHVGARYYDPRTGRFLQRDPMGLVGGFNTYLYVEAYSTAAIDPEGLCQGCTAKKPDLSPPQSPPQPPPKTPNDEGNGGDVELGGHLDGTFGTNGVSVAGGLNGKGKIKDLKALYVDLVGWTFSHCAYFAINHPTWFGGNTPAVPPSSFPPYSFPPFNGVEGYRPR